MSIRFAAAGLNVAICFACFFTAELLTHCGNSPLRPIASVGGAYPYSPSLDTVLRSIERLSALRNAGRLYGYLVVSRTSEIGYAVVA